MPTTPTKTNSFLSPLWLRDDLTRGTAADYWAGPHAEIVQRFSGVTSYIQHLFSEDDHSFWPETPGVGVRIPAAWRVDGTPEIRFKNIAATLKTPLESRDVFYDEQNFMRRCLPQPTGPGGGRWWSPEFDAGVGQRAALLLRRRRGVRSKVFRAFVHDTLGTALHSARAQDLRTYTFLPYSRLTNSTFGVDHDNPTDRRYHGAVIFGAADRAGIDDVIADPAVQAVLDDQHTVLTAVHAYAIDRSLPVIPAKR